MEFMFFSVEFQFQGETFSGLWPISEKDKYSHAVVYAPYVNEYSTKYHVLHAAVLEVD